MTPYETAVSISAQWIGLAAIIGAFIAFVCLAGMLLAIFYRRVFAFWFLDFGKHRQAWNYYRRNHGAFVQWMNEREGK